VSADPHTHLLRQLIARTDGLGTVRRSRSTPWASVTFVGARHCVRLSVPPHAADWLTQDLDAIDFTLPGHIVADIALTHAALVGGLMELELEALTIEDR
jgi:hypothetical protein